MKNKIGLRVSLLIVLGLLGFASWMFYQYQTKQAVSNQLTLYGNVDIRDVVLSFRVSGRIVQMLKEEGDRVTPEQVLATLARDTFDNDLATATAEYAQAQAAYDNAVRTFERRERLLKSGADSVSLYDEALAARAENYARLQIAQASIDKARTALADTEIKAPTAGIILTRVREPGSIVQSGQAVYSLAVDDPVWVRTYVTEPQLGLIYPGQLAKIYTDTQPKKPYIGQVGFISPQAEFTPKNVETAELRTDLVYRLRVIVKNPDHGLRQGMPVTVILDGH